MSRDYLHGNNPNLYLRHIKSFYMKKFLTLFAFTAMCAGTLSAQADNYKAFEWDLIRFGYVIPSSDDVSAGLSISSEPRFNLRDDLSISLRWEIAIFASGDDDSFDVGAAGSTVLFGDYYFNTEKRSRAFAGLGLGLFNGATIEDSTTGTEIDPGSTFGVVPRIGYELGFLRTTVEYNLAFDDAVSNYIGINLGFTIGGGLK